MIAMNDTSMAGVASAVYQLKAVCQATLTLAAMNSPLVPDLARTTASACKAAEVECRKYYDKYAECKACADSCKACAEECLKITTPAKR